MSRGEPADTRRQFLQRASGGALAGGIVALAGCTSEQAGGGGGGGGGGEDDGGGGNSTGSGNSTGGGGGGDVTLRIGGLFPTSGPYSAIGVDQRVGMEVALRHIEDSDTNVTVETEVADTQLDPEQGLRRARELSGDVDVFTGLGSSSVATAVSNFARQNQVPLMVTTATNEAITGEDCNQYTFRSNTHTYQNQKPNAEWAMENLGKTFATMGADYAWGRASVGAFVEVAEQNGGEVVEQVWPKLGATDYSTEIQRVASTDADFLLVRCSGTDGINSAKQIASFGLKEQMDVITNQTGILAQGAGEACIGNYGMVPYHAALSSEQTGNEQNARFVEDYRSIGDGSDPSTYSFTSYMGVRFLAKAAAESGSASANDLVSSLEGLSLTGPKGQMKIRACDHQATNAIWSTRLVSPEGTEFDYPIPEFLAKHEADSNLRPCEETGCSL
ncbi:ABC transporter substrate-binding protein [Halomarina salina]|uniref:ABC transporter substrate-binding protein n=1 Tax=Halomarina salina TaxID=1872699 RepID=A0ABD5RTL9_9EURY|nr:ABC transporter substrate-binding protein [Halomarina salina]